MMNHNAWNFGRWKDKMKRMQHFNVKEKKRIKVNIQAQSSVSSLEGIAVNIQGNITKAAPMQESMVNLDQKERANFNNKHFPFSKQLVS